MLTKKKKIINNTLILIVSSLIIKVLGLFNRIILTRFLGNPGISLYTLAIPTIMLFVSLSSLSLSTAMIKISSKYQSKRVISVGIFIAIIASSLASIILLLSLNTISSKLLKQTDTYYPILFSIPLLFFTSISSVIRGYFLGIEKTNVTSYANIIEQLTRIIFTLIVFSLFKDKNIVFYVNIAIIMMSIGELCSLIYTFLKLKRIKNKKQIDNKIIKKELLDIAVPSTSSSIISNITFFMEPIIFTFVLTKLNYNSKEILYKYSEVSAYALPLITMFSFIPISISMAVMPKLSTSLDKSISSFISSIITIILIPALLICLILFDYSKEICLLLYKTDIGGNIVKKYIYLFIVFYFINPFSTVLLSTGKSKLLFLFSTITHIIKLILLFILPYITNDSLIISYLISYLLLFILLLVFLIKKYHFKIQIINILSILLIIIITFLLNKIVINLNLSFLIKILIISTIYCLFSFFFIIKNRNNV